MAKRKYPTAKCHDCGQPMKVARSNQKWCALCRLAKAARIHRGETVPCPSCDQQFIDWLDPLKRHPGRNMCGRCFLVFSPRGGRESVPGPCVWLKAAGCLANPQIEAWIYAKHVKLCYPCLTDPKKFEANRGAILREYRRLTTAESSATVE